MSGKKVKWQVTNWEKIFGTHVTSKAYKVLISECKNTKNIVY